MRRIRNAAAIPSHANLTLPDYRTRAGTPHGQEHLSMPAEKSWPTNGQLPQFVLRAKEVRAQKSGLRASPQSASGFMIQPAS